jgi:hypothetical protein
VWIPLLHIRDKDLAVLILLCPMKFFCSTAQEECVFLMRDNWFQGIEVLEDDLIFLGQNYHLPCPFSLLLPSLLNCPSRVSVVFSKTDFGHISSFFSVFAQM